VAKDIVWTTFPVKFSGCTRKIGQHPSLISFGYPLDMFVFEMGSQSWRCSNAGQPWRQAATVDYYWHGDSRAPKMAEEYRPYCRTKSQNPSFIRHKGRRYYSTTLPRMTAGPWASVCGAGRQDRLLATSGWTGAPTGRMDFQCLTILLRCNCSRHSTARSTCCQCGRVRAERSLSQPSDENIELSPVSDTSCLLD